MRKLVKILIVFILFSNCKKDEEPSVLINASVTNSSEGTVDFNSGDYVAGTLQLLLLQLLMMVIPSQTGSIHLQIKLIPLIHYQFQLMRILIWWQTLKKLLTQ